MPAPLDVPTEPEDDEGEEGGSPTDPYGDDFDGRQDDSEGENHGR